jgi:surfeit locus 1 family protein
MAGSDSAAAPAPVRRKGFSLLLAVLALLLIVLFSGLGTWQVFRLQWKLDLIARVDARVHAVPAPPPSAARWTRINAVDDEYRRLELHGTYLYEFTTPVQALTEQGAGYWLLTPLCGTDGNIVIVNRGFIPAVLGSRTRYDARRAGPDACAATRGLGTVAPYFVDAGTGQNPADSPDRPTGGLTVISFPNSHLVYAITWYALALMVLGAWWWLARGGADRHE